MNDDHRIQTQQPDGSQGETMLKSTYEQVSAAVQTALNGRALTADELVSEARVMLGGDFEGSVEVAINSVRLDLEAKNVVESVDGNQPAQYHLVEEGSSSAGSAAQSGSETPAEL
jgi:hypothetical protein